MYLNRWPRNGRWVKHTVTPEEADAILRDTNHKNRPMRRETVRKYTRIMISGMFGYNEVDPIVVDRDGNLINGQHRLMSVVESGVRCEFDIVWGADPSSRMWRSDILPPSVTDVLKLSGSDISEWVQNSHNQTLNVVVATLWGQGVHKFVSVPVRERLLADFKEGFLFANDKISKLKAGLRGGLFIGYYNVPQDIMWEFKHVLQTGELTKVPEQNIINKLRLLNTETKFGGGTEKYVDLCRRTQRVIKSYVEGDDLRVIRAQSANIYELPEMQLQLNRLLGFHDSDDKRE